MAAIAESAENRTFEKETCLKFDDVGEGVTRETLKDVFGKYGVTIYWVLFDRGNSGGHILFKEAGAAATVLAKAFEAGVPQLGGKEPTLSTLEGLCASVSTLLRSLFMCQSRRSPV